MDLDLLASVIGMAQNGQWWALGSVGIGLAVRIVKDERFTLWKLPKRWRPATAIGLGALGAVFAALALGQDWKVAVMGGLTSALGAIGGHAVLIEWILGGKEIPLPGLPGKSDQDGAQ